MSRQDCYGTAVHYANLGWHVLALNEGEKTPATANGFKDATTDADQIQNWFYSGVYNLGIATGASGLVVVDIDGVVGQRSLEILCAGKGFADTYTVQTRRPDSHHYYFSAPAGRVIKCSAGRLGEGIDVRAHGGYVVAPPSWVDADHKGPAGSYRVLRDVAVACLPDWLERLLVQPPCSTQRQSDRHGGIGRCDRPETPREVSILRDRLGYISADCSYEQYRNVVWAILSTGWECAEQLALDWSLTASHRFQPQTFDTLVRSYDPSHPGSVSYGTLVHLSRCGGCCE